MVEWEFEGLSIDTEPKPEKAPFGISKVQALEQGSCTSCRNSAIDFRNLECLKWYLETGFCQKCQDEFDRTD